MLCLCLLPACGDSNGDEPDNPNPINPDKEVADPAGTVKLSMRSEAAAGDSKTKLDGDLWIDGADNFYSNRGYIVDIGSVKGLGNIGYIPKAGYAKRVAVTPGHGYIWCDTYNYYRIYVSNYTKNAAGEIIGADIKYQEPFYGIDEVLKPTEASLTFDPDSYEARIEFENTSIIPFKVTVSSSNAANGVNVIAHTNWYYGNTSSTPIYSYITVEAYNQYSSLLKLGQLEIILTIETLYGKTSTITLRPKNQ